MCCAYEHIYETLVPIGEEKQAPRPVFHGRRFATKVGGFESAYTAYTAYTSFVNSPVIAIMGVCYP